MQSKDIIWVMKRLCFLNLIFAILFLAGCSSVPVDNETLRDFTEWNTQTAQAIDDVNVGGNPLLYLISAIFGGAGAVGGYLLKKRQQTANSGDFAKKMTACATKLILSAIEMRKDAQEIANLAETKGVEKFDENGKQTQTNGQYDNCI